LVIGESVLAVFEHPRQPADHRTLFACPVRELLDPQGLGQHPLNSICGLPVAPFV
jgi:hypothetical protein